MLKLSCTDFDWNYHGASKATSPSSGKYVFHNLDVWHTIYINGDGYYFMYQSGMSLDGNCYPAPVNDLQISEDGGACELAAFLESMYASDFDDEEEIKEKLATAQELCPHIHNVNELWQLYEYFRDQCPDFRSYLPAGHSLDVEDYIEDERGTGILTLRSNA